MGRRLALLAEGSHESPWTGATGSESAVVVKGLGEGSKVWVKVEHRTGEETLLFVGEGSTPLPASETTGWLRYQVGKIVGAVRQLTSVEVSLG